MCVCVCVRESVCMCMSLFAWGFPVHAISCNNSRVFPSLISCCSSIWVAHVPFSLTTLRGGIQRIWFQFTPWDVLHQNENKLETHPEVKISRFPSLNYPPNRPHSTFTFTELVSFTFLLVFPRGGLRHISSISLSVCFGLLSTSGQHLTSEQIRIRNPDSAEPDAGLNAGS